MNTAEWLQNARDAAPKLRSLIESYHPVNRSVGRRPEDWITAPNAELACTAVRAQIRKEEEGNPVASFDAALAANDVSRLITLLNQTWFGVPENTGCWNLEGYSEAVNLLDDMPDDEDEEGHNHE